MSRIGKLPIKIPEKVDVKIDGSLIVVKGQLGELKYNLQPNIEVKVENNEIIVKRLSDDKQTRSFHGLTRALLNNMVTGVSKGFSKELEIVGVGYNVKKVGKKALMFSLGYSHPIYVVIPENLEVEVPEPTKFIVKGFDKQLVGEFSAKLRSLRPPEPYKGKGIKYKGEFIRRKAGKTAG